MGSISPNLASCMISSCNGNLISGELMLSSSTLPIALTLGDAMEALLLFDGDDEAGAAPTSLDSEVGAIIFDQSFQRRIRLVLT